LKRDVLAQPLNPDSETTFSVIKLENQEEKYDIRNGETKNLNVVIKSVNIDEDKGKTKEKRRKSHKERKNNIEVDEIVFNFKSKYKDELLNNKVELD